MGKNKPKKKIANYKPPKLVSQLLAKFDGSVPKASKYAGLSYSTLNDLAKGRSAGGKPLTLGGRALEHVNAALAGKPLPFQPAQSRQSHALMLAILIVKAVRFEQLYDIAQHMGGVWDWKRKAGPDYVAILQMPKSEMEAFTVLARAKGAEVRGV